MMLVRNIKTDFAKILSGYGFYVCIFFTGILCFATYIYEVNGSKYSVFRSFISFDREFMLNDTVFCSFEIVRRAAGSWLFLFIPIIAAFAFVPLVCDEYETKSVRFGVFRSTKLCYFSSRFITACLCGGFAVMLGFALFMCAVHILFPFIGTYNSGLQSEYEDMLAAININISGSNYVTAVMKKAGEMFLYGAVCAAPAMMLTGLMRNKYLVLCIPFFLKYGVNRLCARIQSQGLENPENLDIRLQEVSSIVNPDALADLSVFGESGKQVLLYNAFMVSFLFILYIFIQNGRTDSGE